MKHAMLTPRRVLRGPLGIERYLDLAVGLLQSLAAVEGCDADTLVHEAIERLLDYELVFVGEVEKGLRKSSGAQS